MDGMDEGGETDDSDFFTYSAASLEMKQEAE